MEKVSRSKWVLSGREEEIEWEGDAHCRVFNISLRSLCALQ